MTWGASTWSSSFLGSSIYVEAVPETSDAERMMTELARKGCKIIFATSFGYMDYVQNVEAFPQRPLRALLRFQDS